MKCLLGFLMDISQLVSFLTLRFIYILSCWCLWANDFFFILYHGTSSNPTSQSWIINHCFCFQEPPDLYINIMFWNIIEVLNPVSWESTLKLINSHLFNFIYNNPSFSTLKVQSQTYSLYSSWDRYCSSFRYNSFLLYHTWHFSDQIILPLHSSYWSTD